MLISRPAGREAYLSAKAYLLKNKPRDIEVDFDGVKVLTPSWLDEFLTLLKSDYPDIKILLLKSDNPTVTASETVIGS